MPTNTLPNCAGVAPPFRARPIRSGPPLRRSTPCHPLPTYVAHTPQPPMASYHAVEPGVVTEEVAGIRLARDILPRVTGQSTS